MLSFSDYKRHTSYWSAHLDKILKFHRACKGNIIVVLEDFLLNSKKAKQFINSRMETSKLIGVIQVFCDNSSIPIKMVKPVDHLSEITDDVLCDMQYIKKTRRGFDTLDGRSLSNHTKDALRIAVFFNKTEGGNT